MNSLVHRPSRSPTNIIILCEFTNKITRRSGQFYDVMMMSSGRGLDFLDIKRLLPTRTSRLRGPGDETYRDMQ